MAGKNNEKTLAELTEVWMSMERKTFPQRQKAEKYYFDRLMKPIVDDYIVRNQGAVFESVDYLVLSVGTSYEPLVLNIALLKPKRILFLYTEKTEKILNTIVNFLKLEADAYTKRMVDATSSLSIYREIKQAYVGWQRPDKVYIDFTGGTKTMSAAAALAGSLIDVQLVYVGTENYLTDFRKPAPGSERLYYIENPLTIFGDLELEKIFVLITRGNYAGAAEKLVELKDTIPDPVKRQQLNFVYLLVRSYEHWDALEFPHASAMMEQLVRELKRDSRINKSILMADYQDILDMQCQILGSLSTIPDLVKDKKQEDILKNREQMLALMFSMYQNAIRREKQQKYDMATLLLYRLLEMIEQKRLMNYHINIARPDYSTVDYRLADEKYRKKDSREQFQLLKQRNFEIKKIMFPRTDKDYLPSPIALLDGFTLLAALGDEICQSRDGNPVNALRRIRSMVYLRNNSIFAHGLGPVGYDDYEKFRDFVTKMFVDFCDLEEVNIKQYEAATRFVNPSESKYYSSIRDDA